jgi:hypothetical protein
MGAVLQWSFFGKLVRHESGKIHLLSYCYTKMHQVQSWPSGRELFGLWWRKNHS